MPELGSAYFTLAADPEPLIGGVEDAEAAAKQAADEIAASFGMVDEATMEAGQSAQAMAAEFDAAGAEMAAGVEEGAAGVEAASAEAAASGEAAATEFAEAWDTAKGAMMGMFAGGMVIGGMEMLIGKTIEYGHTILQLAAAFHMSSEEASRLQAETEMVGMQGSSVMMTISRLTKAAGDATGTTAQAMEKWGIDVAKFRTADAQEQLQMLSDAYADAGKRSTQFLSDVLGGRGMKLAPLISEFDELNKATEGIDFPAPSPEEIIKEERFKVQMDNFIHTIQFGLVPVLVKLAPLIAVIGGMFVAWKIIGALAGMFRAVGAAIGAFTGITDLMTASTVASTTATLGQLAAQEAENAALAAGETEEVAMAAGEAAYAAATAGATGATVGMTAALTAMAIPMLVIAGAIADIIGLWKLWQISQETAAANTQAATADMRTYNLEVVNSIINQGALTDEQVQNIKATAAANEGMGMMTDLQTKLDDQVNAGRISWEQYNDTVHQLGLEVNVSREEIEGMNAAQKKQAETLRLVNNMGFKNMHMFKQWRQGIMQSMTSAMTSVGGFQKKWTFTGHSFVKTMNQMAAKDREMVRDLAKFDDMAVPPKFKEWLISQGPDAIHGFMESNKHGQDQVIKDWKKSQTAVDQYNKHLGPTAITAGNTFDTVTSHADDTSTAIDGIGTSIDGVRAKLAAINGMTATVHIDTTGGGGKATGGPVNPGTSYIVGEKGPELFVPDAHGTIIPNNHLNRVTDVAGGSGSGSQVTIHRFRIEDWETGMASLEVMARHVARDEQARDAQRTRMRRTA